MHDSMHKAIIAESMNTGDMEPTAEPVPGKNVTQLIKAKAMELGFGEVGNYQFRQALRFQVKRNWVKFPHAICLAYEQTYEPTQTAPSIEAEGPHFGTYRIMGALALDLGDYIRSLGYRAQVHNPSSRAPYSYPCLSRLGWDS